MIANFKKQFSLAVTLLFAVPQLVSAQLVDGPDAGQFQDLIENLMVFLNDVILPAIIGLAFLFFVWGMFKYFIWGGADDEKKAQGKSLLIHSIIGFVVIIIFYGVINLITSSIGLENQELKNIPEIQVP